MSSVKYKRLSPRDHVYTRPGMYVGSINTAILENVWVGVIDESTNEIKYENKKTINYNAGLLKIFDEILMNAVDQSRRSDTNVKNIKVDITDTLITITNDGLGISSEIHEETGIHIPELIFGHLLTSSNYDDDEKKMVAGQNGIGAKATNVLSKYFEIETVHDGKIYSQIFRDNLSIIEKPIIKNYRRTPFTKISFIPDYEKFGYSKLDNDMRSLFIKRAMDCCICTPAVIHINGIKLKLTFNKWLDLFIADSKRAYLKVDDNLEIAIAYNNLENGFSQVSFVNGVNTIQGGTHVDFIAYKIINEIQAKLTKKKIDVKPAAIKQHLLLFINCNVVNPTFNSQSKETLTTARKDLKFTDFTVPDSFTKLLLSSKMMDSMNAIVTKQLAKTDGAKRKTINDVEKLTDAEYAGTSKSDKCTLILTEGDSGKTMALSGLLPSQKPYFGVFPLRGKLINVLNNSKKSKENEEITNIKKILGLKEGETYLDTKDLRYGRVLIMCDQDYDGSHIKGLIFNLFNTRWPSLLKLDNFITSLATPIIKVSRGGQIKSFYTINDYDQWKNSTSDSDKWTIKYYKGLGTSRKEEAQEYFKTMKQSFYLYDKTAAEKLDMAFNNKRADDRKAWLAAFQKSNSIDFSPEIKLTDFIDKELIHFSNYDTQRSIPNVIDGLKISQRKVLFGSFKKNNYDKKTGIKVAQLAGYIAEQSEYHHGENSLTETIIGMAQKIVGINNINLLFPNGQFGTRRTGGDDAAAARYIFTCLDGITDLLFPPIDREICNYLVEEGTSIEPEFYLPILPLILINGADGIGTGYNSKIPCYNPINIAQNLVDCIDGVEQSNELLPWYRGFKGTIEKINGKIYTKGIYEKNRNTINITELPIGIWSENFINKLKNKYGNQIEIAERNVTDDIDISIKFPEEIKDPEKELGLCVADKIMNTRKFIAFDESGKIKDFVGPNELIAYFYNVRLGYYEKRKAHLIKKKQYELLNVSNIYRFKKAVYEKEIVVTNIKKDELIKKIEEMKFDKYKDSYSYLYEIPIYRFTKDEIEKQQDKMLSLQKELKELENMNVKKVWKKEIREFAKAYLEELEKDELEK